MRPSRNAAFEFADGAGGILPRGRLGQVHHQWRPVAALTHVEQVGREQFGELRVLRVRVEVGVAVVEPTLHLPALRRVEAACIVHADQHVIARKAQFDPLIKRVEAVPQPVLAVWPHAVVGDEVVVRVRRRARIVVIEVGVEHHARNVGGRPCAVAVAQQVLPDPVGIELAEGPAVAVPRRFRAQVESPELRVVALSEDMLCHDRS